MSSLTNYKTNILSITPNINRNSVPNVHSNGHSFPILSTRASPTPIGVSPPSINSLKEVQEADLDHSFDTGSSHDDSTFSESASPKDSSRGVNRQSANEPNSIELQERGPSITNTNTSGTLDDEADNKDPEKDDDNINTLYSSKEVGWKGRKTLRLILERYCFGAIVAVFVSLVVYLLSMPQWSGAKTSETYLNTKTYSIFYSFAILLFGPVYITLGFMVSYGFQRIRESRILYYSTGVSLVFSILYAVLYRCGINYWYYYLDALGVVLVFVFGEVLFAYKMSITLQEEDKSTKVDYAKARMIAYNYSAPDIIVTICTVLYMFFLLPVYFSIESNLLRLGWRLVIHPIYWVAIVMIARQFLTRDISTDDIMLNSNIVLHTFFHHQTLGRIFVYTFSSDTDSLTEIGMVISAVEDIILRGLSLKRDEWVLTLLHGRQAARDIVYSQQSLQLRSAILNIQVGLEFSGLITAPLFIYMFQKHRLIFHFYGEDELSIVPIKLFWQTCLSIGLDIVAELVCTYIECRVYKLPIQPTWRWMKSHKGFLAWLVYGSITMGFLGMLWTCARVPRAGLCSSDDICTCNSIIASSVPSWCNQASNTINATSIIF
eukprot:gene5722-6617_t